MRFLQFLAAHALLAGGMATSLAAQGNAEVRTPPASFFELVRAADRDSAKAFYTKYLAVGGLAVVAHKDVQDLALQRTKDIVLGMLAKRPDVLDAMVKRGMYLIIIGKDQVYTDMPEYRNTPDPNYMNERVRGTGGKPTSFGEENLLSLPLDRYDDESIAVHEFLHTIDSTLATIEPDWSRRKNEAYRRALDKGLYKNTYAAGNAAEFWAEAAQAYFDCNRINNWNHGPVGNRNDLKTCDPDTYALVEDVFRKNDWRYQWLQKLPNVTVPPAKFKIDPYYTKFTWAREFNVVGREASDEALLKANDIVRKMFAYRHDVLKALINEGAKLVVLGQSEASNNLPEFKTSKTGTMVEYDPAKKTIVTPQEPLLKDGGATLIGQLARAMYRATAFRPVDPNWDKRGRNVQQYELRVKRLDVEFDAKLRTAYESAMAANLWREHPAANNREEYWVAGVKSYFDGGSEPATTREALKAYDSKLFALVAEILAYEDKVDWRLPKAASDRARTADRRSPRPST
jgi:hypothetical protein